jgi:hypothetical protein
MAELSMASNSEPAEKSVRPPLNLDVLAKLVGATAVGLYAVGLLTVNSYLYHLGVSNFELLKARFVYTGAIVVIPIVTSHFCVFYGLQGLLSTFFPKPRPTDKIYMNHWFESATWCLVLLVVPFIIFFFLTEWGQWSLKSDNIRLALAYCFFSLTVSFPFHETTRIGTMKPDLDPEMETPRFLILVVLIVLFLGATVFFISNFASDIYPKVPEQFGGGKPRSAQFFFVPEVVEGLKAMGFTMCEQGQLSDSVAVLFEDDNSFVVRPKGGKVMQIDKKEVRALLITSEGCHKLTEADKVPKTTR